MALLLVVVYKELNIKMRTILLSVLFIFGSAAKAEFHISNNPIVEKKVAVKSWKKLRDLNIVKQDQDFSCGAASIATLLNNFYGQNLTEDDILTQMGKEKERASFDDMQKIMPKLGFQAKGYALTYEQLTLLKIPAIVYLKYRKNEHFSVLRGIDKNTVLLADPSLGHISMSKFQFLKSWDTTDDEMNGKILAILPLGENINQNDIFFKMQPKRNTSFSVNIIKNSIPKF